MKDKMEQFFEDNKDDFDMATPPASVWLSVEDKLRKNRRVLRFRNYAIAASVALLIGTALWFMQPPAKKDVADNTILRKHEINDTEAYYTSLIDKQHEQLMQFSKMYPEVCKDFQTEIDTLSALYGQLKVEYKNSNGNEAVLQAMIENLRTQVQLLNGQMQIILSIKQKERKPDQKTS